MSRLFSSLALLSLIGCDSGLDAWSNSLEREDQDAERLWWWWWPPVPETAEPEPEPEPEGDPDWFDATCEDGLCVVRSDFDPRDHLDLAQALCADAMPASAAEGPRFQRLWFTTERVWADAFDARDATWTYRFVARDTDDLWGYRWFACDVDVTAGTVDVDSVFESDSLRAVELDAMQHLLVHGLDHALADLGGWRRVSRGGIQWHLVDTEPQLFLSDESTSTWHTWSAVTGERTR